MSNPALLSVRNLSVRFPLKGRDEHGKRKTLLAVDNVSFDIPEGKTLGIVGESGSGKTTAALAVARLVEKAGQIILDGHDFGALTGDELRIARQNVQIIFQDPYSSLNPRLRAEDIVREPRGMPDRPAVRNRIRLLTNYFMRWGCVRNKSACSPINFLVASVNV